MSLQWHIGCSGFHYKEWKGTFYPDGLPATRWFDHYCRHFSTLELNNTFYRFPEPKTLKSWYDRAPDPFLFSVKATRTLTHEGEPLKDKGGELKDFYAVLQAGLHDKLGAVLFQFPPHYHFTPERLLLLRTMLQPPFRNVVEFRHPSWWRQEVYEALALQRITFCGVSYPDLSPDVVVNGTTVYYRFHGLPKLYFSAYSKEYISAVHRLIQGSPGVRRAFIYFNNTAAGAAPENARFMMDLAPISH